MKSIGRIVGLLVITGLILSSFASTGVAQDDISPVVPAIASFIIPGSGQLINDQHNKALTHFVVGVALYSAYSIPYVYRSPAISVLPALNLAWSGYSAYDAYQVAERRGGVFNSSLELEDPERGSFGKVDLDLSDPNNSPEFSVSRVSG